MKWNEFRREYKKAWPDASLQETSAAYHKAKAAIEEHEREPERPVWGRPASPTENCEGTE